LYQSRDHRLWVGTWGGGLNVLDPATGKFSRFIESEDGLTNNTVLSIYEDSKGTLWLGTYGGGLNRFDPAKGTFSAYTDAHGLPNNVVYGILPDRKGNLWLTTNKGLARFSPATGTCRVFDANDGLQGNEFNQGAYHESSSGELFVGGVNGVNAFFPEEVTDNPTIPPVYLTSFRIFDKPANLGAAVNTVQRIQLEYDQNYFSFEFVALDFSSPEKNRYAYRLEGLDASWIDAGRRRFASYTNLDPGQYVFRCRGSNSDGVWNESGAFIELVIAPPYWKTWWFQTAALLVVLGSLFLIYRVRVNKLIAIERIRTSIATDLHDDIGSTLTEIALFSDVGKRFLAHDGGEESLSRARLEALQRLDDIGEMARALIDSMSDIVWSVNPKNDTVESLLLRMRTHAGRVLDAKGIRYELSLPSALPQQALQPAVRRALYLIFKEAVNNIVRHSTANFVRMEVARDRSLLGLTIVDNGRGFDTREIGIGNGVNNMRNRAATLGGECRIVSSREAGTTVKVQLPLH
ncbi:MAG: triple tyrosine motif-containing protein, partial [Bacteroidota bacterium]